MTRFKFYNKWSEEEKISLQDSLRIKCREVQDRMRALDNSDVVVEENSVLAEIRRVCQFLNIEDCRALEDSIINLPFYGFKHYLNDALMLSRETLNDEEFLVLPPITRAVLGRLPTVPKLELRFALVHALSTHTTDRIYCVYSTDDRVTSAILTCFHYYLGFADSFDTINIKSANKM